MDPALWLLWRLRLNAFFRRLSKNLRSVKGIAFTLLSLLVFVPWLISLIYAPRGTGSLDVASVRRYGSTVLLGFAVLSLLFSNGERALFFSPAEIAFLFPGPFTRRSLLAFKVVGLVAGCVLSGLFMALAFGRANRSFLSSYVAITLTMLFFQFMTMAVGLASNTVAAFAIGARRKFVLIGAAAIVLFAVFSAGRSILEMPPADALKAVEASPVTALVSAPFRPFVLVYTADRFRDLIGWAAVCLAMVGAMAILIFTIDAQYFETAAASSAKIYERLQRMRTSGGIVAASAGPKSTRFRLAMLPWLGGVGPILWRQLLTAGREPVRILMTWAIILGFGGMMLYSLRADREAARHTLFAAMAMTLWLSIFLSPLVAFDFRGDIDRMDELKRLPTSPAAIVVGQIMTPVLIFAIPQWLLFAAIGFWVGGLGLEHWAAIGIAFPAIFLMFAIENLFFLLFPTRSTVANPADFAAFGRQILLIFSKILCVFLTLGASALMGAAAYYFLDAPRVVCLTIALLFAYGFAIAFVPMLVVAFDRYDVASDTPA